MSAHDPSTGASSGRSRRVRRPLALLVAAGAVAIGFTAFGGAAGNAAAPGAHTAAALPDLYGTLPPTGTAAKGGTITIGQLTGSTPTQIFPILSSSNSSIYNITFIYDQILPLYNGPNGSTPEINYAISLAAPPKFSDGDKTVTIDMKQGYTWSNGQPVDANDLLFGLDLVEAAVNESPANWSAFTPGFFPQSVKSIAETGKYSVVIHLKRAYNPSFFLNNQLEGDIFPMPSTSWDIDKLGGPQLNWRVPANAKKIYDFLAKEGTAVSTFATDPLWKVVDGPFVINSFNPTNSTWTLNANPHYTGPSKPAYHELEDETFTGITPELNALKTGALDIGQVDFSQLNQVSQLRSNGYSVYGWPDLGFFYASFNFKDKTGHFNSIISQLYVRQALAYLEDEPAYVTGIYKNAGVASYGPVPSVPPTPFTPADAVHTPYPYNPGKAVALLKSHGWKVVPNGQTTCAKAGSGAGECGAGIPAGTPFKFTWFYIPASETPSSSLESEAYASEAKTAAGINIVLGSKTFNFLYATYNDANPADAKYENDWGVNNYGGFTQDYYPTTESIFNTTGVYNQGAYSNPMTDSLVNASVYGSNPHAVTNEASFITQNLPGLFMPNGDYIYAVSKKVGGTVASFMDLTQEFPFPQFWYLNK